MNEKLLKLKPSSSAELMAKAKEMQKKDSSVISLAGGEPDFDTPQMVSEAAIKSLREGNTHYVIGPGIPELRKAITEKLLNENGIETNPDNIIVTPGGKNAIYLAINAVLNNGDEAIILNPAWVSYEPIVSAAGGVPVNAVMTSENDYEITEDILESAFSEKTRLLIINYPNNPTGRILHEKEADIIKKFMLKHPEVYLISDEIYESIVYDNNKSISMASFKEISDRVITVNGFSKSMAMTGWRMGYMSVPKEVFNPAYKLYQHSLSCMSGFLQYGALASFKCSEESEKMRKIYEERRDIFVSALNAIHGVNCKIPEGAFYAWVRFDVGNMNSFDMCEYLIEDAGVVGMPGAAYGEQECFMRFSFAAATEDIKKAAERIKKSIEKL